MSAADGPVVFDPADFGAIPSARGLRRWMRTTRRRRADRSFWQMFEDVYLVVFTLAMAGATGGNVLRQLNETSNRCTSWSCMELAYWIPLILMPLLLATTLRILLSVGPVSASRAAGFWLLATPVSRAALLRPAYWSVMATVAVVGSLASVIAWALLGAPWGVVGEAAVVLSALLVCAACVTVWAQQSLVRTKWTLRVADLLLIAAAVPALWLATRSGPDSEVQTATAVIIQFSGPESGLTPEQTRLLIVGLACLVVVLALVIVTARTLSKLSRTSVIAGGELLAGLAGAASSLDISMLADVVSARHWRLVGRRTTRRGRGSQGAAIVHREFLRILRWPRRLVIGFALLVVPYAVAGTGFHALVPAVAGFAGFFAVRPLMDGLRSVCRSTGLVRALGMDLRELRVVMAVVPGLFAALWVLAALPALGDGAAAFAVAAGMLSGAVRQASARPPSYAGPLVASPMGAIPPGLFSQPIRGFDLLLVCLAPVLLGLSSTWVLVIPGFVLAVMFAVRPKTD
ncbi:hypothetical protein EV646_1011140 [Kribbella antiqua]|uniref:ABC-2 type transport system permease protein n=1 Tax=Kribbella antiqua TaxID=2512217 RepID=A0A4R2J1T8_9ACTN|nr:DUF6297 family protein [Kribbella antiqua]TCO52143.1 hypothetical protein EV646_1011140 [Kribbella antiqua]